MTRTEKQKMLAGEPYEANDPQLVAERDRARGLCQRHNQLPVDAPPEARRALIEELFGAKTDVYITPPFFCDYGSNIRFGDRVYFNFNCVILDVAPVSIGHRTLFGPAVQVYTAGHPMEARARSSGVEWGKPIAIGDDVWIGGGAIICPGVTIGDRSVIGAGSVVTRDVPADVFAAGNPCRVVKPI